MIIPTTPRLEEIDAFADELSRTRRNFEGTGYEKAREQIRYSKVAEMSLAEFLNATYGTDYTVDLEIHSKPTWEPDLTSDVYHGVEVKTCNTAVSPKKSWVFQYPYKALEYPHAAEYYLRAARKVDEKLLDADSYAGTMVALTSIDKDDTVSLDYVVALADVRGLLKPLRSEMLSFEKAAIYDDRTLRASYKEFAL